MIALKTSTQENINFFLNPGRPSFCTFARESGDLREKSLDFTKSVRRDQDRKKWEFSTEHLWRYTSDQAANQQRGPVTPHPP